MKENVGRIDQAMRAIAGPSLAVLGYSRLGGHRGDAAGLALMIMGALIAGTAVTRVCPLNAALGIDTHAHTRPPLSNEGKENGRARLFHH